MTIKAFPDTNILMEYRPLHEIPWRTILGTEEAIVLLIAPQVTQELNQHKGGKDRRKQDKAKRATKDIDTYDTNNGVVREGVTLEIFARPVPKPFLNENGLDTEEGDDRIIGGMLLAKQVDSLQRYVLVSEDINHRHRAKGFGFETCAVPEEYRLPGEADPRD